MALAQKLRWISVAVASGTDFVFNLGDEAATLAKIQIPSGIASTALTIKPANNDASAYAQEYDNTNTLASEQTFTIAASRVYRIKPSDAATIGPRFTLTCGSTETAKTIWVAFRTYE